MTGGQRRGGPQPPTHDTHPLRFLSPQPTRAAHAEESAPTWNGAEEQQEQERAEQQQHPWRPRPGEGSQRRRHSAGLRGHALRPPSHCPPAVPRLRSPQRRGRTRTACASRSGTGVARRGVARGGRPWTLRLRRGRRTGTRSKEAGGPESPAWGRSEAVAGGGGGGGVDSTAAAGLGTTFYIWPLVWGPRGRRGRRRETLGGGRVAVGSRSPGWRRTGPRRTMHLGVKPRLRVSGPRPRPLCLPSTVEDRATKAEPPRPSLPPGPLSRRLV